MTLPPFEEITSFLGKVSQSGAGGCWLWKAYRSDKGYGRLRFRGKGHMAHRVSYTLFSGTIPEGLNVCHKCDNPPCVNPAHLFVATQKENVDDMIKKGRKVVARGEDAGLAKLTLEQVEFVIKNYRPKHREFSGAALARQFGVTKACIHDIIRRKSWRHTEAQVDLSLRSPKCKLTAEQARFVKENYRDGRCPWLPGMSGRELAKKFGVDVNTISNIVKGKTWRGA